MTDSRSGNQGAKNERKDDLFASGKRKHPVIIERDCDDARITMCCARKRSTIFLLIGDQEE
jgi:hypothetical protein